MKLEAPEKGTGQNSTQTKHSNLHPKVSSAQEPRAVGEVTLVGLGLPAGEKGGKKVENRRLGAAWVAQFLNKVNSEFTRRVKFVICELHLNKTITKLLSKYERFQTSILMTKYPNGRAGIRFSLAPKASAPASRGVPSTERPSSRTCTRGGPPAPHAAVSWPHAPPRVVLLPAPPQSRRLPVRDAPRARPPEGKGKPARGTRSPRGRRHSPQTP